MKASLLKSISLLLVLFTITKSQSEEDVQSEDDDNLAMRLVVDGNSKFAKLLYFQLKDLNPNGNFVASPYSISILLGMLRSGTFSNKKVEMQEVLQMKTLSDAVITEGFSDLIQNFADNDDIEYKSLERIYVPATHTIRTKYKDSLLENFQTTTGVRTMDFAKSVTAAQKINGWMSQKTKGELTSIISPDSITKDTKLVAISGVYFDGTWENSFTLQKPGNESVDYFFVNDTHASGSVTMMNQHGPLKYANLPDMRSEAVAIPFSGERLEMILILPKNRDGLQFPLEDKLRETKSNFSTIIGQLKVRNVNLFLPKLDFESFWTFTHSDRNGMMTKLGLNVDSSQRGILDYNNMTPYPGLFLDKIIHKIKFSMNEIGVHPPPEKGPGKKNIEIRADHPFTFLIYDTETKSILLMGRKIF